MLARITKNWGTTTTMSVRRIESARRVVLHVLGDNCIVLSVGRDDEGMYDVVGPELEAGGYSHKDSGGEVNTL